MPFQNLFYKKFKLQDIYYLEILNNKLLMKFFIIERLD